MKKQTPAIHKLARIAFYFTTISIIYFLLGIYLFSKEQSSNPGSGIIVAIFFVVISPGILLLSIVLSQLQASSQKNSLKILEKIQTYIGYGIIAFFGFIYLGQMLFPVFNLQLKNLAKTTNNPWFCSLADLDSSKENCFVEFAQLINNPEDCLGRNYSRIDGMENRGNCIARLSLTQPEISCDQYKDQLGEQDHQECKTSYQTQILDKTTIEATTQKNFNLCKSLDNSKDIFTCINQVCQKLSLENSRKERTKNWKQEIDLCIQDREKYRNSL